MLRVTIDGTRVSYNKFNSAEMEQAGRATGGRPKRTTVAGRLKTLLDAGRLVLVSQGQGRQPSVYRRSTEAA